MNLPVRVYSLKVESRQEENIKEETVTRPELPDKPSIAVLPFDNMSADPEQEYFSNGISEDILTDLSKLSGLFVISRNSSFAYRGKSVNAKQISQELGVRYLLEGSVRKAGKRLRISAQLIDAIQDDHLWAERYDRDLEDIFSVQDEVSRKIVEALKINLTGIEEQRLGHAGTWNLEACDLYLQARETFLTFAPDNIQKSIKLLSKAIDIDPNYALAYALKSRVIIMMHIMDIEGIPENKLDLALHYANRAVELDSKLPYAYASLGWAYMWKRQIKEALEAANRSVEMDPNDSNSYIWLSMIQSSAGMGEKAIKSAKTGMRLNPLERYNFPLGIAYYAIQDFEQALASFESGISNNPRFYPNHFFKVASLALLDKPEVHAAIDELYKMKPHFRHGMYDTFFVDENLNRITLDALRKYGLIKSE